MKEVVSPILRMMNGIISKNTSLMGGEKIKTSHPRILGEDMFGLSLFQEKKVKEYY